MSGGSPAVTLPEVKRKVGPGTEPGRSWFQPSDLPAGKRMLRWAIHFPGDIAFERSEPAAIVRDVIAAALFATFATLTPAHLLLAKWISSRVPAAINIGRSLAHRNPDAKPWLSWREPGEFWHRDWTYFSRPRAHQLWYIAKEAQTPLELEMGTKIPAWVRKLSESAETKNKFHPVAIFEDWICNRSRVVGFVADTAFVTLGLVLHFVPLSTLMYIETGIVLIPGLLGGYIGLRNHCLLRALRGGVFQRDGVIGPKKAIDVPDVETTVAANRARNIKAPATERRVVLRGWEADWTPPLSGPCPRPGATFREMNPELTSQVTETRDRRAQQMSDLEREAFARIKPAALTGDGARVVTTFRGNRTRTLAPVKRRRAGQLKTDERRAMRRQGGPALG